MTQERPISAENLELVDTLYRQYLQEPASLSAEWQAYFSQLGTEPAQQDSAVTTDSSKQIAVLQLINAYRFRGHKQADLNPLPLRERPAVDELDPGWHGLGDADMDGQFHTGSLCAPEQCSLREILSRLRTTYCGHVGAEYMHISDTEEKRWFQQQLETRSCCPDFKPELRRHILKRVISANGLEQYLHNRYVGQKRFSLEGGESLIPLLDEVLHRAGDQQIKEVIIGMAHRGRLNVLVNILGKRPATLFSEFEGKQSLDNGSGDVKYHQGFSSDIYTPGGTVHLALAFNPSHLEIINPVVEGSVRARQKHRQDYEHKEVMAVLIHGDAAVSGQGVVTETLNLSQTRGYSTGGTVHIVVNNQIGFTTSDPLDARSMLYCTDIAKMVQAPILHVNGDDPEAVVYVTQIAMDYRRRFKKDIFIDLVCYRRHGHSEADEPAATQPMMYQHIRQHKTVDILYRDKLIAEGVITLEQAEQLARDYEAKLDSDELVSRPVLTDYKEKYAVDWSRYTAAQWTDQVQTGVDKRRLSELLQHMAQAPDGFGLHKSVAKILDQRRLMAAGEEELDWGAAELLAYATLVESGYPVRLSGQDSGRGTFFHRHSVLHNQENGERYIPLQNLSPDQSQFLVIDSLLSEESVLAFEFGYSASAPETLVIWEAQFGDFANNAQVVIDQFICSSAAKWQRFSGLVMFLPHGYDGQGPEHSSARLERYLQLCAEENMQVCYPSTPAQMFHMLRRQMLRNFRRPLIVMTPKSLLRHKHSKSTLDALADDSFQVLIDDHSVTAPDRVHHVILCSGKIYFDLDDARQKDDDSIAIIRLEQLYPFPHQQMEALLQNYPNLNTIRWVQEEPWNQGAWFYIHPNMKLHLQPEQHLDCATRPPAASPAVGYLHRHLEQQKTVVSEALDFSSGERQPDTNITINSKSSFS